MNPPITGDELRKLREQLDLNQDEMASRLGIAREWLSKLENGKAEVSAKVYLAARKLSRDAQFTIPLVANEEASSPYGRPADRAACENYTRELLDEAEKSADPNAFPYILRTLQKTLPLGDFAPGTGGEEREAERQRRIDEAKARMPAPGPAQDPLAAGHRRKFQPTEKEENVQ